MTAPHELQIFHNDTHKSPDHTQFEVEGPSSYDRDRDELARLGKKQVLKQELSGGPAGLIYGFLVVWVGTLCVFITLGELSSMAPTFLSYTTGWLNVIGWQAFAASGAYLCATIIQGLIVLNNPGYNFQRWHGTLLLWAVIGVAVLVNTVISSLLPKIECVILIIHVLGFFAIMIPLVYMAPHGTASDVFTLFLNEGGWKTTGLSFFVGLYGNVFAFLGQSAVLQRVAQ
ncbi:MAG: hypothetical protein Q9166_006346 [cf. Caloplaca sp. 2 TL-2023]